MNFPTLASLIQLVNVEPLCIYHGIEISASQIPSPANKITTQPQISKTGKTVTTLTEESVSAVDRFFGV